MCSKFTLNFIIVCVSVVNLNIAHGPALVLPQMCFGFNRLQGVCRVPSSFVVLGRIRADGCRIPGAILLRCALDDRRCRVQLVTFKGQGIWLKVQS